jgi:hypothetical protein
MTSDGRTFMTTVPLPAPISSPLRPATAPLPTLRVASTPKGLTTAETAECTCPEFCERDHANE